MSLDISLISKTAVKKTGTGVYVRDNGQTRELSLEEVQEKFPESDVQAFDYETNEVFSANLTHNLTKMADQAELYDVLWNPHTQGWLYAREIIPALEEGLKQLKADPEHFKQFNPENGWGSYENLVSVTENYLAACKKWKHAEIEVDK
jgi:hypothetical protein